ncbi:MAG TPA: DUF427 domain-containing protein [Candidatus Saccharimonadales bacterium]|nr:DUF427 domain-containing protein [Candidatus Saccharimonadales bacterium]
MKAIWKDTIIAEAPTNELIRIEGNWYFPPQAVRKEYLEPSDHHTICPWKGDAGYFDVVVNNKRSEFGAWYYSAPKTSAIERVGKDFSNYIAFWNGIEVIE